MEFKYMRMKKGLTQEELGAKVGVSSISIGNYENGKRAPNYIILEKLSIALEVDIIVLVKYFQKKILENEND